MKLIIKRILTEETNKKKLDNSFYDKIEVKKSKIAGKTITLKIKYSDFTLQTRSKTVPYFVNDKAIIADVARDLLYQERLRNSVRLLGISLNNLNTHQKKFVVYQLKFEF
jgi:DNA polymerase-4